MRFFTALAAGSMLAQAATAYAFEQTFSDPAFVVSVPSLPDIPVGALPASAAGNVLARGQDANYVVEISATASSGATTRKCAGASLREFVARPNMPGRDNIYRAPADSSTFLVLYVLETDGKQLVHAHLLSAAGGTHCIDAHFSRRLPAGDDIDNWRTAFSGARVRETRR